jgi:hypothetical protein
MAVLRHVPADSTFDISKQFPAADAEESSDDQLLSLGLPVPKHKRGLRIPDISSFIAYMTWCIGGQPLRCSIQAKMHR